MQNEVFLCQFNNKYKLDLSTMKIDDLRRGVRYAPPHGMRCGSQKVGDGGALEKFFIKYKMCKMII